MCTPWSPGHLILRVQPERGVCFQCTCTCTCTCMLYRYMCIYMLYYTMSCTIITVGNSINYGLYIVSDYPLPFIICPDLNRLVKLHSTVLCTVAILGLSTEGA